MTRNASSLDSILKSDCCSGCGLCAALSGGTVEMRLSAEGFLRPHQTGELPTVTDRLIAEVCPGVKLDQTASADIDHPLWGPIVAVRVGAATDEKLRHHASSGGALSAFLLYLLDSGTVDYVVQTAASETAPLENVTAISTNHENVYDAAGSRYAPSAPLMDLHMQLDRPGRFALVGKPCDIAAVRALARHDARVEEKIAVLVSFFCAGVPSIKGARGILDKLGVAEQNVARFRYRGDGWPGRATATLYDRSEASMSYADSWGGILSRHTQFRCKICPDGSGGFADIVYADAWHCDDAGYPIFEEQAGRSLIVSRTRLGEGLVEAAMAAGHMMAEPLDPALIEHMQPSQANRKRYVLARLAAMAVLGRRVPRFHGFNLARAARSGGIWPNLKNFLGMGRRLLTGPR